MQKAFDEKIVILKTNQLYPHPDNPRKEIGDITEMAESVKKNGIMQNLTVIPLSCLDEEIEKQPEADEISLLSDFIVLIGHRRLSAAKKAKLEGVPCRIISKISKLEQVSIMMEENMQRNDLTPYEQAQGFQMMLNLGGTTETISEKTGFSKSTIYHRLNMAKLDQEELQKKEKDSGFQLSLTAIYELEKIENIETRNKVLKDATDNQNLVTRARNAVREEKRTKAEKEIVKLLKEMDVKRAPSGVGAYDSRYEKVKDYSLDKEIPKEIELKGKGPFVYLVSYGIIYILKKAEKKEKKKTKEELLKEDREKRKRQLKAIVKEMDMRRRLFVLDIISENKKTVSEDEATKDKLWQHLMAVNAGLYKSYLIRYYTQKDTYSCTQEEKEDAEKWIDTLTTVQQMMVFLSQEISGIEPYTYYCNFNKDNIQKKYDAMKFFEQYGWYFNEEEQQLLEGTHELYEKTDEKK